MYEKKVKSPEEKLAIRLKTGALAEKGLAYSLLQSGLKRNITISWDYKTWWIGDIIAVAIFNQYEMPRETETREFWMKKENLIQIANHFAKMKIEEPSEYEQKVPSADFDCIDVRKRIGKNRLSNKEIFKLVEKFVGVTVVREGEILVEKDGDSYSQSGEIENVKVCKIEFIKTGKFSNRNKEPEYSFRAIFDKATGLRFWNCVRYRLFDYRAPSYYSLKAGSQLVFRAIGWTKGISRLKLEELCWMAGVKKKNITDRQRIIESYLAELLEEGWIQSWKTDIKREGFGGRKRILYTIFKRKRLPKK